MKSRPIQMTITGPRGRNRCKTVYGRMQFDDGGVHILGQMAGPFGGTWLTKTSKSYEGIVRLAIDEIENGDREQMRTAMRGTLRASVQLLKDKLALLLKEALDD